MTMTMVKIACVQLCATRTIADNIETSRQLIRSAANEGAEYVQTPEMTHLVESDRAALMRKISNEEHDEGVKAYRALARELGIFLHIGSLAILRNDGKIANRGFVFCPEGKTRATYDKIHMFDVDLDNGETWRESKTYEHGTKAPVVALGNIKLGMSICYDVRFPHLFRQQALAGANILTVPACFTQYTGKAHWHVLLRARAIETGCFVIAAAQGGKHEDGRTTFGHSIVVSPWGNILAEADGDVPGVIAADLNLQQSVEFCHKIPSLNCNTNFTVT